MSIRRTVEVRLVSSKELAEEFVASMDNWLIRDGFRLAKQPAYYPSRKDPMMSEFTLNGLRKMTKKCYWRRYIYNGYEPENVIVLHGIETEKPGRFVADGLSFFGAFNDGAMNCSITRMGNGKYRAIVDRKETYHDSFEDAFWDEMPAYLTHPDHDEESKIVVYQEVD